MHYSRLLLAAALFAAGCTSPSENINTSAAKSSDTDPTRFPAAQSPFAKLAPADLETRVESLLARMTLAQKIGQMTSAEVSRTTPEDVKQYHLGSVLNGGGGFLDGDKYASVADWVAAMDRYWAASMDTSDGGLAIPIMWGTDAVHGHNKVVGATLFPHNINLGATRNPELTQAIAAATAKQVLATGMDWTYAPAVSVVRDDRWGRTYEGFSEDPELVSQLGRAAVLGYQGAPEPGRFMTADNIVATAKHFIADGGTIDGVDRGDNRSQEAELARLHGAPYAAAIEAGALTVMASHSSWFATRLHGHQYLLTDVLKGRLGFQGFVVGDWNSHGLVEGCENTSCPAAINAGMDMLMVPFDWREWIVNTIADVEAGKVPMARIDDAVRRILKVKILSGLMDAPRPSERPYANRAELLNSAEMRALARQAVRESLVLLKNNDSVLPIAARAKVLVAGPGAHNIAMQTGGWTISWQSTDLTNADFPNATSIMQGIEAQLKKGGGSMMYAADGNYKERPDVAVVVFGEPPYAEWMGDLKHLAFEAAQPKTATLLRKLKADGIPTVAVYLGGRPLWLNPAINAADSFVAAFLPGTEGGGVADLLIATDPKAPSHDFSGKLPYSWPATPMQTAVNVGDEAYQPLFPYGYGLTYAKPRSVGPLPEDFDLASLNASQDEVLFDGTTLAPWQMMLTAPASPHVVYRSGIASNGGLTATEADQSTQGDAVNLRWDGSGAAAAEIVIPNANRNFTELLEGNGALTFDVRLLQTASAPLYLSMACRGTRCGEGKPGRVDLTTLVNASPKGDWNNLTVSLKCFAQKGVNFEEIGRVWGLETAGSAELQVTGVRLAAGMGDKAGVQCD